MRLLKKFICKEGLNLQGRIFAREAVRGIIRDQRKVLMIHSTQAGDYKFPGGGIDADETHEAALRREVREECGVEIVEIGPPFGKIIEVDAAEEEGFDVFTMNSYYYLCKVDGIFGAQKLDRYEEEMGYRPKWVDVDVALRVNTDLLTGTHHIVPRWTRREAFVLELVKSQLCPTS